MTCVNGCGLRAGEKKTADLGGDAFLRRPDISD
jgi:hypothetical protein